MGIRIKTLIAILILFIGHQSVSSQSSTKYDFKGYLQTLEMLWINDGKAKTMNTISNRLDFNWYINEHFTSHIAMRNILSYGQLPSELYPFLANLALQDQGKLNLTYNLSNDTSHFAYSQFDRAQLQYTTGNLEITIGRQRINWGINLVWTPNDIFNSFNYLDFDYEERAGSDAVLVQYYTGMASSIQFAYKLDHNDRPTYAALYRFNEWNYDFQFLAGVLDKDYVFGSGWAGQIKSAGFLGEATYFYAKKDAIDSTNTLVASISANYTFKNSLFVQTSILFNSSGTNDNAGQGNLIASNRPISAKDFTRAKYALFAQLSIPITPLINADMSGIFNPGDKSAYIGPSFFVSLSANIEFMIIGQFFMGRSSTEYGDYGTMLFSRLKWSF